MDYSIKGAAYCIFIKGVITICFGISHPQRHHCQLQKKKKKEKEKNNFQRFLVLLQGWIINLHEINSIKMVFKHEKSCFSTRVLRNSETNKRGRLCIELPGNSGTNGARRGIWSLNVNLSSQRQRLTARLPLDARTDGRIRAPSDSSV